MKKLLKIVFISALFCTFIFVQSGTIYKIQVSATNSPTKKDFFVNENQPNSYATAAVNNIQFIKQITVASFKNNIQFFSFDIKVRENGFF
jgi:hypothetical protein